MAHRLIKNDALILTGPVGGSFFSEQGFSDTDVIEALSEMSGDITVRVNSGGGSAFQGIGIYNALKGHDGKVTVAVDGVAASAASIIAMAGEEIIMRDGAIMMIHNASGLTAGTAKDHAKTIEALTRLDGQMSKLYAKRAGMKPSAAAALMDEETWLTGEEAVAKGLATKTDSEPAAQASHFDYSAYAHAPQRLVAQAAAFTARFRANPSPLQEKPQMAESPKGGPEPAAKIETIDALTAAYPGLVSQMQASAAAAERDRIKAIEENTLPGHEALTAQFKFDGKTTAPEAAIAILKAEKAKGGKVLKAMAEDETKLKGLTAEFKPANDPTADKPVAATDEAGWKKEFQASAKLKSEFLTEHDYTAFKKAEAVGGVKIYAPRAAAAA